ncbi:MAG: hypothetical protein U5J83_01600 [Bryobacterales bacterium]|nr:hypothetical protein [Bryobacterales bacterium]
MSNKMFRMHMLVPGSEVIQAQDFELTPTNPQGEEVCELFHRFLVDKPAEFRLRLPFLKHDEIEMEWAAAPGGTALCTFYEDDSPLASAVLLSGLDKSSDNQMATLYEGAILDPVFGKESKKVLAFESYPSVAVALLGAAPERAPAIQLFYAALASVFFRQMSQLRGVN